MERKKRFRKTVRLETNIEEKKRRGKQKEKERETYKIDTRQRRLNENLERE